MYRINYEIFGDEGELTQLIKGKGYMARFSFGEGYDGFLSINSVAVRVKDGVADFDLRLIDDGEWSPVLILKNRQILLPALTKNGRAVTIADCGQDYLRSISLRERDLAKRVADLEQAMESIRASVYGTTLF